MPPEENSNIDWRNSFPDELKLHPSILKFKEPTTLAKSYVELEKMMGSRVALPDFEKAKPEELNQFYDHWGRPKESKEYDFGTLPDGVAIPDDFGGAVKTLAYELGLNKRQFDQLTKWGINQSMQMYQEQQKEKETSSQALQKEWGFRYKDNLEKAHRSISMLVGGNDKHSFVQFLETSGMGDHPEFLKLMLELSDKFKEDKLINTDIQREELTKDNARKKINEIRADTKHAFWNGQDPRHADAVKEMDALYKQVYPTE